jgi:hypothetical protein
MPACMRCGQEAGEFELVKRRPVFWMFFERTTVGRICRPCLDSSMEEAMTKFDVEELYMQAMK